MPKFISSYVKYVDLVCEKVGRFVMYWVFFMMFLLILSFVTRNIINYPLMWIIEMAQFTITAYYLLGGGYSMITDDHVRMDLFYGKLSKKGKAKMDIFTSVFLIFYLVLLFLGSITSLIYTIETKQKLFTAWAPYVWPIKTLMLIGILLMLLQAFSTLFKDFAKMKEKKDLIMLAQYLSYEFIALFMFITMLVMMFTGQRVFGAIGFVAAASALLIWGEGSMEMPYTATWKLFKWYPMLTLPLFIYMGFMISESGIANDLYKMFHVLFGGLKGGLAIGTMFMMVAISAMNGLSVAGMAIGATIALPEMLKRNYDKRMITGVVQAGSSLGILIPPSVVMVLYGMIARQPVSKLWMAGILPGLLMASLFLIYIYVRCKLQPELGPPLKKEEREVSTLEKIRLLKAGIIPFLIFFFMTGLFLMGIASLVECSAVGAFLATLAAIYKRRFNKQVLENTLKKTLGVSCMFMWIILAALTFGAVFDGLGAGRAIETLFIERWNLTPWGVLIMMQLSYILMGMFLDDTAMLVIVAPLYVPLIISLGFDPIWYGVLYTITCQIAYMTPPFGYNLFLMRAMAPKEITLQDIYRSILPFVLIMVIGLAIVMAFPEIATYLPEKYLSR